MSPRPSAAPTCPRVPAMIPLPDGAPLLLPRLLASSRRQATKDGPRPAVSASPSWARPTSTQLPCSKGPPISDPGVAACQILAGLGLGWLGEVKTWANRGAADNGGRFGGGGGPRARGSRRKSVAVHPPISTRPARPVRPWLVNNRVARCATNGSCAGLCDNGIDRGTASGVEICPRCDGSCL
jgi:hypothetical protein